MELSAMELSALRLGRGTFLKLVGGAAAAAPLWAAASYASGPRDSAQPLTFWSLESIQSGMSKLVSLHNRLHPRQPVSAINFNFIENNTYKTAIKVAMAGNAPPDIFFDFVGDRAFSFVPDGEAAIVNDAYKQYDWRGRFYSWMVDRYTAPFGEPYGVSTTVRPGSIYGIPTGGYANYMWYNKDLFRKLALAVPRTYQELLAVCAKLKAAGYIPLAFGNKDTFSGGHLLDYVAYQVAGPDVHYGTMEGSVLYTNRKEVQALQALQDLGTRGYLGKDFNGLPSVQAQEGLFFTGRAGMHMMGSWFLGAIAQAKPSFNVGVFLPPPMQGQPYRVVGDCSGYQVAAKSPREKLALAFLDTLTSTQGMPIYQNAGSATTGINTTIPANKNVSLAVPAAYRSLAQDMLRPLPARLYSYTGNITDPGLSDNVILPALQALLAGSESPAQVARRLAAAQKKVFPRAQ